MGTDQLTILAEQLVTLLRVIDNDDFEPWDDLTSALESDQTRLTSAVRLAGSWGYEIAIDSVQGLKLTATPDRLLDMEILSGLKTEWLGQNVVAHGSVTSTNDIAAGFAKGGAPEGTIVTAEEQTKGRGRLNRHWVSPYGSGVYVSVVLKPKFSPELAPGLAIATAIALADSLHPLLNHRVKIKWPNDILIDGRKVAGILTELSAERDHIDYVVVGVGININQTSSDFPDDISKLATSLRIATGDRLCRVHILQRFLEHLEREYTAYHADQLRHAHEKIRKYSSLIGQQIEIRIGQKVVAGTAVDIDEQGRLIMQNAEGTTPITAGEVTVVKR